MLAEMLVWALIVFCGLVAFGYLVEIADDLMSQRARKREYEAWKKENPVEAAWQEAYMRRHHPREKK